VAHSLLCGPRVRSLNIPTLIVPPGVVSDTSNSGPYTFAVKLFGGFDPPGALVVTVASVSGSIQSFPVRINFASGQPSIVQLCSGIWMLIPTGKVSSIDCDQIGSADWSAWLAPDMEYVDNADLPKVCQ
jgi:mRNA-degrading endonuclease toxin of MazEF toxin-antitoxin module